MDAKTQFENLNTYKTKGYIASFTKIKIQFVSMSQLGFEILNSHRIPILILRILAMMALQLETQLITPLIKQAHYPTYFKAILAVYCAN